MGTPSYEDIFKNVILPSYQQGIGQLSEAPNMANLFRSAKAQRDDTNECVPGVRQGENGRECWCAGDDLSADRVDLLPGHGEYRPARSGDAAYQDPFRRSGAIGQLASGWVGSRRRSLISSAPGRVRRSLTGLGRS